MKEEKSDADINPNDENDEEEIIMEKKIEEGIIQKKLKILVINGEDPGENGENWAEAKALVQNGTGKEVEFNGAWSTKADFENLENKYLKEEGNWQAVPLCYAENADSASAVMCLGPDQAVNIGAYSTDANVVVLLNSDKFNGEFLKSKDLKDMFQYRKVISYGSRNKTLDGEYLENKDSAAKYVHLKSKEGCENLLKCIQQRVDTDPDSSFIGLKPKVQLKYEPKCIIKEKKGFFNKVKKYAKKNPKKTKAGMVAGAGIIEELLGQFLFGKSIFGGILGYNSNPKEKDAKNVKDNKKDEKKSNKEVSNPGN